jgi:putative chitinase
MRHLFSRLVEAGRNADVRAKPKPAKPDTVKVINERLNEALKDAPVIPGHVKETAKTSHNAPVMSKKAPIVDMTAVPEREVLSEKRAQISDNLPSGKFDSAAFFTVLRQGPLRHRKPEQLQGTEAIIDAMHGLPLSWCAYALATAWLETKATMQPIKESFWLKDSVAAAYAKRMYDIKGDRPDKARELGNLYPGDGALFMGRGYVQLTGRANYERAANKIGYPLVGNPDLAMRPDIAAQIMREGMVAGWFTGRGFVHFLPSHGPATIPQFRQARRIINGLDKADKIASDAHEVQAALIGGNWA